MTMLYTTPPTDFQVLEDKRNAADGMLILLPAVIRGWATNVEVNYGGLGIVEGMKEVADRIDQLTQPICVLKPLKPLDDDWREQFGVEL